MASFNCYANASLEVWNDLILKSSNQRFVPGVEMGCNFRRNNDFVIRQMTVTTDETSTILKKNYLCSLQSALLLGASQT
jgi:hypothetical protein